MDKYSEDWVHQQIQKWEQRLKDAQTEQERKQAQRELAGYRQWLNGHGNKS